MRWFGTVTQMGAAAILLGDAEVAADLFELTAPIAHYYSGDGSGAVYSHGANAPVGELALSRLGLARALLASSGSLVEAAALAAEAASEFRRLDMPARASEAARLVADIADRRPPQPRTGLAPKTRPQVPRQGPLPLPTVPAARSNGSLIRAAAPGERPAGSAGVNLGTAAAWW